MKAFRRAAQQQFVIKVTQHIRQVVTQRVDGLSAERVQERIHDGLDRTSQCSFTDGWDVCRFIELRFRWGNDFADRDDMEWAGTICRDPDWDLAAKVNPKRTFAG